MYYKKSLLAPFAVLALLVALSPSYASKAHHASSVNVLYRAQDGKLFTAAQAAKYHFVSPNDHSKLVRVTTRATPTSRQFPLASLPQQILNIGNGKLHIWVMNTEAKREEGLMFVTNSQIKDNQAMLFVFPFPALQEFWMKNTLIPLDIAFIDSDGKVLNTTHMLAEDLTPIPSNGPAKYALEMKVGTLKRLHIHAGMHVAIPRGLKAD